LSGLIPVWLIGPRSEEQIAWAEVQVFNILKNEVGPKTKTNCFCPSIFFPPSDSPGGSEQTSARAGGCRESHKTGTDQSVNVPPMRTCAVSESCGVVYSLFPLWGPWWGKPPLFRKSGGTKGPPDWPVPGTQASVPGTGASVAKLVSLNQVVPFRSFFLSFLGGEHPT